MNAFALVGPTYCRSEIHGDGVTSLLTGQYKFGCVIPSVKCVGVSLVVHNLPKKLAVLFRSFLKCKLKLYY